GVLRCAERDLRRSLPDGRAQSHAAVADRARRGDPARAGRRFLAVRTGAEPQDALDVSALLVRAGSLQAIAAARRAVRAGGAGIVQDLMRLEVVVIPAQAGIQVTNGVFSIVLPAYLGN